MITKRFLIGLATATLLASPLATKAAMPNPGDLIKASGPSVYYYGQDGKRYVFPNEKIFSSWYSGFDSVKTISDTELASIALGANVTYRPGIRLVKITTDPKTYAVAFGGVLRHIATEAIARELYGTDWNTKVDDIADTYFINYRVGTPITSATEYSVNGEISLATSIGRDKGLDQPQPTPAPTPTPTPTSTAPVKYGTLEVQPERIALNELVTLIASAQPTAGLWFINLSFNGFLQRRCEFTPCGAEVRIPASGSSFDAHAEFVWIDGTRFHTTTTVSVTAGSPGVTLTISRPEVEPNTLREFIVDVDSSYVASTIDIYLDGGGVRGCNNVQQCRYTAAETSPVGTVHSVYGVIRDANGFTRQTATKTFTVVTNDRPIISISPGKTSMLAGEMVDVTVQASDDDGIAYTEIVTDDGTFTKRCQSSLCTAQIQRTNAGTFRFIGRASDSIGALATATSSAIVVQ